LRSATTGSTKAFGEAATAYTAPVDMIDKVTCVPNVLVVPDAPVECESEPHPDATEQI